MVAGLDFPGPPPPDRPKFRSFLPFPATVSLFLCLSGPHQTRPPALPHDSPRTPNVHISGHHASKHHQNSTRRPPERHRNSEWWREKKKREILAPPPFKDPPFWAHPSRPHPPEPHLSGPHLSGPHPAGPHPEGWSPDGQNTKTLTGQSVGPSWSLSQTRKLAKVGQIFTKVGLAKVGQHSKQENWPKSVWPKPVNKVGQSLSNFSGQSRIWPKSENEDGQSRLVGLRALETNGTSGGTGGGLQGFLSRHGPAAFGKTDDRNPGRDPDDPERLNL